MQLIDAGQRAGRRGFRALPWLVWLFLAWPSSLPAQESGSAGPEEESAARAVVARLHAALIEAASADGSVEKRYRDLLPVVRATHDLAFIAELTIRRQWRDLSDAARSAFVDAFERLSVTTYASRFAAVGPESFTIVGVRALDDGRVEVNAEIVRRDDPNVSLDYVLQRAGDQWRIVNILADGVSDLALKRAEYQRVFRAGGEIDDLIATLEAQADAL